jgi:membrane-bound ClpP family serine protease
MGGFEILGLVLLVLAFVFIGIECVIPGFGAPGILGLGCLAAGIALSAHSCMQAAKLAALLAVLMAAFIFIILKLLASGKMKSPIILEDKLDTERGFISSSDLDYLIGRSGVTVTALRPAGKISVDELVLDVISAGPFIEKGKTVKIIKVSNNSLMVCETDGGKS